MESPSLTVTRVSCRALGGVIQHPGDAVRWQATWLVHNAGTEPLDLEAAWIPHGRFRGDGRLPLSGQIKALADQELEFSVTADETPGTVVDNAFLILRLSQRGVPWRIFIRMRIEFDPAGVPRPIVEAITSQCLQSAVSGSCQ